MGDRVREGKKGIWKKSKEINKEAKNKRREKN
jgi:hypothetical protein